MKEQPLKASENRKKTQKTNGKQQKKQRTPMQKPMKTK